MASLVFLGGFVSNNHVKGALLGVSLLAISAQAIAADKIDQRNVTSIPAVAGEAYLVEFNENQGTIITGKKGERLYAHSFKFDLLKKERIGCWAQTNTDVRFAHAHERPDRDKGPRPGWKVSSDSKIKGKNKIKECDFGGVISDAGRYDITFTAERPGTMRVYFYNEALKTNKDLASVEMSSARLVDANEMAGLPAMAAGMPVYMGIMPEGGTSWLSTKPEKLRPYFAALLRDAEYNAVGNFAKLGVAAMAEGEIAIAEWALDHSLDRIEAIYADDEVAKAARSKFTEESIKDFKGDPYERAMAYYYRGLLYLREGDFGNARASFASAEYQDTVSEAEEFQSDFGLMNYLAGWSARCLGNEALAGDAFAAAQRMDSTLVAPESSDKTLIVAEAGQGPVKQRRGRGMQMVGVYHSYGFTKPDAAPPVIEGTDLALYRAGDISYQATTRGGRQFDAIMNGKVAYKNTMGTLADLSTVASIGSSLLSDQLGSLGGIGGMLGMFGGIAGNSLSDATKASADVRYWDSLPDAVFVGTANAKSIPKVRFSPAATERHRMVSEDGLKCNLVWVSDRDLSAVAAGLAGTPLEAPKWREKEDGAQARDDAFRQNLMAGTI